MGIQLLVTAAIGHIKKYFNTTHIGNIEETKMYFVTEQFYQMPSEGIFSLISSLFGQSVQTKKDTTQGQPSLLDLHLAERNQNQHHLQIQQIRDDRRRRQG